MRFFFGKWIGKVFSFLFVFMTLLYSSTLLYHSGSFLTIQMIPNTPMAATNILMAVRLGLETIARSAEIFFAVFLILFILLVLFIIPEIKFENIEPIFEGNIKTINQASFTYIVVSCVNAVSLLIIFPAFINQPKKAKKSFLVGSLIGGLVVSIITILCIFVLGSDATARQIYPSYSLAKRINVGNFANRVEALMAVLWIIALYIKMVLYFYASVFGLAQILNLRDYRPLTYPLGIIVVVLSLVVFPNVMYQQEFERTIGLYFSATIGLLFPLIIAFLYVIRKKHF